MTFPPKSAIAHAIVAVEYAMSGSPFGRRERVRAAVVNNEIYSVASGLKLDKDTRDSVNEFIRDTSNFVDGVGSHLWVKRSAHALKAHIEFPLPEKRAVNPFEGVVVSLDSYRKRLTATA